MSRMIGKNFQTSYVSFYVQIHDAFQAADNKLCLVSISQLNLVKIGDFEHFNANFSLVSNKNGSSNLVLKLLSV